MSFFPRFSGVALKRFACILMLIDHIGASCLQRAYNLPYLSILQLEYIPLLASDAAMQQLLLCNTILRCIGRLAMPIFAYFLVEGFLHTHDCKRYLLRLVCFGVVSEPFFDLAFFDTLYYPAHQNIYATLSLALVCLMLLRQMEQAAALPRAAQRTGVVFAASAGICIAFYLAECLHTDYGAAGVLLVIGIYLLRAQKGMQLVLLAALTYEQFPAPFAALALLCYDGTRGRCAKWEQWAFYAFYPAHLMILCCIAQFILR